jgi:hypothetical protein
MDRVGMMASPHPLDDEASITEDPDSGDGLSNFIMGISNCVRFTHSFMY